MPLGVSVTVSAMTLPGMSAARLIGGLATVVVAADAAVAAMRARAAGVSNAMSNAAEAARAVADEAAGDVAGALEEAVEEAVEEADEDEVAGAAGPDGDSNVRSDCRVAGADRVSASDCSIVRIVGAAGVAVDRVTSAREVLCATSCRSRPSNVVPASRATGCDGSRSALGAAGGLIAGASGRRAVVVRASASERRPAAGVAAALAGRDDALSG
jgi:hypothetical protein